MIRIKRVYEEPRSSDGVRILVDRLWPRGLTKARAKVDQWRKELAPSTELRKWFAHDPEKWKEFRARYKRELADKRDVLNELAQHKGTITLLYAARDEQHNEAVVLKEIIEGLQ